MSYFINENKLLTDNTFMYEDRLNSSLTRFSDKTPTYTTYFNINTLDSTIDAGYRDIEDILGNRSPLRYNRINNLPIYGIEQIVLALQDNDEGLNSEYSSEGVILPNTIKPLPNDLFIIEYLAKKFIFRVTAIDYDNIKIDNFFKISFRLEWISDEMKTKLDEQVVATYSCVVENIGGDTNCIINEEYLDHVNQLDAMYNDMATLYKTLFYNERYDCFIGESGSGAKLFDPLQSVFINKHKLFHKKSNYETLMPSECFNDPRRGIKYAKSIYNFFERKDIRLCDNFHFATRPGSTIIDSSFARWYDSALMVIEIPLQPKTSVTVKLLPDEIVKMFKFNIETESKYLEVMRKFIREDISIYDIPLDLNDELLMLNNNEEIFFFTPILMYIIKTTINNFLNVKKDV